jgi:fructuronate reductase
MRPFLSRSTLQGTAPTQLSRPPYDPSGLALGVVHFGPGAFHRAHQAWFVERLLPSDPRWGICAVSLRSSEVRDALEPQDGLYTLVTLDRTTDFQVIGALRELLVAPENPERVLQRLCAAQAHVVTITVTEKGYCLDPEGNLDMEHPAIRQDLRTPHAPVSLIGYLVEALDRRRASGTGALTLISCDNMADNGGRLARAVEQLAGARDSGLARWIQEQVPCPRTMVDSITPATTEALRRRVADTLGFEDRWPVQRESFVQWVMEDRLGPAGPDWRRAGVIVTSDVAGYESAKLRLLNAAHSTLAYVGLLLGHETVAAAMADQPLARFVVMMMTEEIVPTLRPPPGLALDGYIAAILQRFRNPAVNHALAQIAWDGSQKLPFRVLGTILDNLQAARPVNRLCVPLAAWMHFIRRKAQADGQLTDPLAERLLAIGRSCQNRAAADVPAFLALDTVFAPRLAGDARFREGLSRAYDSLASPQAWLATHTNHDN